MLWGTIQTSLRAKAIIPTADPKYLQLKLLAWLPIRSCYQPKTATLSRSHFLLWVACIQWLIDRDYQDSVPSLNVTERPSHLQGINRLSWGLLQHHSSSTLPSPFSPPLIVWCSLKHWPTNLLQTNSKDSKSIRNNPLLGLCSQKSI